jgi:hypothetical protein
MGPEFSWLPTGKAAIFEQKFKIMAALAALIWFGPRPGTSPALRVKHDLCHWLVIVILLLISVDYKNFPSAMFWI